VIIVPYTIDLADITENDRELVGGKAYNLAKLIHLGINVPEGFTVTTEAYEDMVGQNPAIHDNIDKLRSDRYTLRSLVDFSENLYDQFQQADMPSGVSDAITTAYEKLGGKVAVRSSGSAEDLDKFAFAGALLHNLDVCPLSLPHHYAPAPARA
jgi:pyruvate,water dikinase